MQPLKTGRDVMTPNEGRHFVLEGRRFRYEGQIYAAPLW